MTLSYRHSLKIAKLWWEVVKNDARLQQNVENDAKLRLGDSEGTQIYRKPA